MQSNEIKRNRKKCFPWNFYMELKLFTKDNAMNQSKFDNIG